MPRRCTICHHPQHENIAVSLFRDGTRTTARRFQVSRSALDRHKRHFPGRIVEAQQAEAVCEAALKVKSHPAVSCAIYTRHCQDVCEAAWKSHQEQRDACKAFVASERQHGWRALPTRYIDSDSSRSTMQRSSLRRLLEHVQKGMIHVVVVYRLEHLSANLPELAKIIEMLYQHKVSLVSLSPRLNTSEPAGRLAVSLLLSFARFESKLSTGSQAMVASVTPLRLSLSGSKPAEYEKFLQKSQQQSSEFQHTIRTEFLLLGSERKQAFLSWARKGFGFRKPAASHRQIADSAKTA
jgi:DNA invertase Pin-like site-specific DNA recombinase